MAKPESQPTVPATASAVTPTAADLEMRVMALEMAAVVPGRMVCDVCKFALTTTIMNMATGGFGPPIAPSPEPCPNGCGPLRPLTWKEDADDATKALMRYVAALEESVKLQSHYAELLNGWDGGQRLRFEHIADWMNRLDAIGHFDEATR